MKEITKFNSKNIPYLDDNSESELGLFDPSNEDISLMDMLDDELIRLSGSKLTYYKYYSSENYDELFDEERQKTINNQGVVVYGHYDPKVMEENLSQFGVEVTNDQLFTFNKSYIERRIGRAPIAGDIIKPKFQNVKYEVIEVQQDAFHSYGVYHYVCTAKLLRDTEQTINDPLLNRKDDVIGGEEVKRTQDLDDDL